MGRLVDRIKQFLGKGGSAIHWSLDLRPASSTAVALPGNSTLELPAPEAKQVSVPEEINTLSKGSNVLEGWVFSTQGRVRLEFRLESEVLWSGRPWISRADVYTLHQEAPASFLSGFRFDLPGHLLDQMHTSRLRLIALRGNDETILWTSTSNGQLADEPLAITELRQHFAVNQGLRPDISTIAVSKNTPFEAILFSNGCYSSIKKSIQELHTQLGEQRRLNLRKLWIVTDSDPKLVDELAQTLSRGFPALNYSVSRSINLSDFSSDTLVFSFCTEVSISALDLIKLSEELLRSCPESAISPIVLGCSQDLPLPCVQQLAELDLKHSRFEGSCLVAQNTVGPVWLAMGAAIQNIATCSSQRSFDLNTRLPALDHSEYCLMPLNTVLAKERLTLNYDRLTLNSVTQLYNQADLYFSPETLSDQHIYVVVPQEFRFEQFQSGPACAILNFISDLLRSRQHVTCVRAAEEDCFDHSFIFNTHIALSLNQCSNLASEGKLPAGLVYAADWTCLRTANILAYLSSSKVAQFVWEDQSDKISVNHPELEDCYTWSRQSDCVAITPEPEKLADWDYCREACQHAVHFCYSGVPAEFYTPEVERQAGSVLLLINSSVVGDELNDLLGKLRQRGVPVTLGNLSGQGLGLNALQSEVRQIDLRSSDRRAYQYALSEKIIFLGTGWNLWQLKEAELAGAQSLIEERSLPGATSENIKTYRNSNQLFELLLAAPVESFKTSVQLSRAAAEALHAEVSLACNGLEEHLRQQRAEVNRLSIVVPVYNALDAVSQCLRSLLTYAPQEAELIVVNDCSDQQCSNWLKQLASKDQRLILVEHSTNQGFIAACRSGVKAAREQNDVILLNSDVVVTKGLFEKMQMGIYQDGRNGLASPLSTGSPHFQVDLAPGETLNSLATLLQDKQQPSFPVSITPEGQCLYIRRFVLKKFGFFDQIFGRGYFEESDLCLRALTHGVRLILIDNAVIAHRRAASFGSAQRNKWFERNRQIFFGRWGRFYNLAFQEFMRRNPVRSVRRMLRSQTAQLAAPDHDFALEKYLTQFETLTGSASQSLNRTSVLKNAEVVFILPSVRMGGGSLSVLQHVNELLAQGVEARVISLTKTGDLDYPLMTGIIEVTLEQFFNLDWNKQKVIATFWLTAYYVDELRRRFPDLTGYYYVQDYEPWFYNRPEQFSVVTEVERTYKLGLSMVAKTQFLCDLVKNRHGEEVQLITPGLARTVFYPGEQDQTQGRVRLAGMLRSSTARRGGEFQFEIFRQALARLPELEIRLFGDSSGLPADLCQKIELLGPLTQEQVAQVYRESDLVVDFSSWQGFGRMGIEGMACGAVPVLTDSGGISRYATHAENSLIFPVGDVAAGVSAIITLACDRELRLRLRRQGLASVLKFSEPRAARDWIELLNLRDRKSTQETLHEPGAFTVLDHGTSVSHLKSLVS